MPAKRRGFGKRKVGRGWLAHKRNKVRGPNKGDAKKFFKLRVTSSISTDGSGNASFSLTDNPSSAQDWSSVAALFDQYRVCAMKIKYIPTLQNDLIGVGSITNNLAATATTSTTTPFRSYAPFYVIHDPNDTSITPSVNAMIEYENMKVFDLHKPWSYYKKMAKQFLISGVVSTSTSGYQTCGSPQATQVISAYGSGFTISVSYGVLIVSYYLSVKGRK